LTFVMQAQEPGPQHYILAYERLYYSEGRTPPQDMELLRTALLGHSATDVLLVMAPQPAIFYTPYSYAALCSGHWSPQEVALAFSGANELRAMGPKLGLHLTESAGNITYLSSK
jgi:hypothetical protein